MTAPDDRVAETYTGDRYHRDGNRRNSDGDALTQCGQRIAGMISEVAMARAGHQPCRRCFR